MKVLITNSSLNSWGGSQVFSRDLAVSLQSKGHEVVAFSSLAAETEPVLDAKSIRSVTDLKRTGFVPDVIHAQSHMDAMTAISAFPNVPAVNHIHGAVWKEGPVMHPRIDRHFTITDTLKERLMIEWLIPEARIHTLLNGVDTERFSCVREPPDELRRALIYTRYHSRENVTGKAVVDACKRMGIAVDFVGMGVRRLIKNPEKILPDYDVVFACGISAMDALACGCATVILGQNSCGPLLVSGNYERMRKANFNIPMNSGTATSAYVERELRRYDPAMSRRLTRRFRGDANISDLVDKIVEHYGDVVSSHDEGEVDGQAENQAYSAYFQRIAPVVRMLEDFGRRPRPLPMTMDEVLGGLQGELARLESDLLRYLQ